MSNHNREFYRQQFYTNKIILVDGIARTGKSMLGPILSSFENIEIERIEPIFDIIPLLEHFGQINKGSAIALLRLEMDNKLYDTMISRNTNFRYGDHTSAFRSSKFSVYLRRMFMDEGDEVVQRIRKEGIVFQTQTHDILGHCNLYFEAFKDRLYIIEVIRHPIDVVYSLFQRGWGMRYGTDPKDFTLNMNYKGVMVPWHAIGWEKEYIKMGPMDRLIKYIDVITKRNKENYEKLDKNQSKQVLFIPFEQFITKPMTYIKAIEQLIGKRKTARTKKALKRERCPRVLDLMKRKKKIEYIKDLASNDSYKMLLELSKKYEKENNVMEQIHEEK